jgi:hypothetical protein
MTTPQLSPPPLPAVAAGSHIISAAPRADASDRQPDVAASSAPLARHAGTIAIVAGALFASAQLLSFVTTNRDDIAGTLATWPYRLSALAVLVGFPGLAIAAVALYERQAGAAGRLGAIGLCAALLGTSLLGGDLWFETFAVPWYAGVLPDILTIPGGGWLAVGAMTSMFLFSLGWLLFGVASLRAKVFPRLVCLALTLGGVVGFYAALPPFGAVLGAAVLWLGITLLHARLTKTNNSLSRRRRHLEQVASSGRR